MKQLIVALSVFSLLFVPISTVQAQTNGETIVVNLNIAPDPVYVNADDYIVLRHGWGACTPGFIQQYLNAVHTEVTINDVLVSEADGNDQYWGAITEAPDGNWVSSCIAGNQHSSRVVDWRYPLGTLTPGAYVIHFYYWFDHKIADGADYDGDGHLDIFEGVFNDRTFTIIVSE